MYALSVSSILPRRRAPLTSITVRMPIAPRFRLAVRSRIQPRLCTPRHYVASASARLRCPTRLSPPTSFSFGSENVPHLRRLSFTVDGVEVRSGDDASSPHMSLHRRSLSLLVCHLFRKGESMFPSLDAITDLFRPSSSLSSSFDFKRTRQTAEYLCAPL